MIDKSILAVAVLAATTLLSPSARAADLPALYIAPTLPVEFQWSGPNVGGRIGGGGGIEHDNLGGSPSADSFSLSGGLVGIYGGMNWQDGHYVYGFEGDADLTSLTGSQDFFLSRDELAGTLSLTTDFQGFFRGRVGYAVNRLLFYAAAGLGVSHATLKATGDVTASDSGIHVGPSIAGGIEYAITDQLVARGEAQFTSFGNHTYNLGDPFNPVSVRWDQLTATIGLSYRF